MAREAPLLASLHAGGGGVLGANIIKWHKIMLIRTTGSHLAALQPLVRTRTITGGRFPRALLRDACGFARPSTGSRAVALPMKVRHPAIAHVGEPEGVERRRTPCHTPG